MNLIKEQKEFSWIIRTYSDGKDIKYEFISLFSKGIDNFDHDQYIPLEDLHANGYKYVLPYPNPFEVLTDTKEAVFQNWMRNIIKRRVKEFHIISIDEGCNQYGPIYIEIMDDTEFASNISVRHEWKPIDINQEEKIRYCISVSYRNKE